jgi:hypothetical protein
VRTDDRFNVGDLVKYYVFTTYYYGEGSVRLRGTGIIIKKEYVQWSPYTQRWIEEAVYENEDDDGMWRYDVLCSKTGNTYDVSPRGLMLIKAAKKEE